MTNRACRPRRGPESGRQTCFAAGDCGCCARYLCGRHWPLMSARAVRSRGDGAFAAVISVPSCSDCADPVTQFTGHAARTASDAGGHRAVSSCTVSGWLDRPVPGGGRRAVPWTAIPSGGRSRAARRGLLGRWPAISCESVSSRRSAAERGAVRSEDRSGSGARG